jgi:hypothetical protein
MNQQNYEMLDHIRIEFVAYLETNKTKESSEWDKYTKMDLKDLISELEIDIHKYEIAPNMYISYLCNNLGMDYNTHNETLIKFIQLFSDVIKIIYA